ncbi:ANTAR domain-containing protein [Streptomyces sp. SID8352]|uniref:ANTAR domain-containing protein n=1 Tax=Streptomyces sp. SID8352 TaxID=2690338 RepID=UPI00136F007B|nr:ANTAR domain-containing protein [Streptomyces sp. SID8352]MYU21292.1 ANTAR domain-containing protein [Streptomyces sp. SID8352]
MTSAAPPRPAGGTATALAIDGRVDADSGRVLLLPRGDLARGCVGVLAEALAGLPRGVDRIDADMTGVVFMDASGLQFLDLLGGHGRRRSVPVTATHWHGQPSRFLDLAGLDPADPLHTPSGPRAQRPADGARRVDVLEEEVEQLRRAIASRPVIDQARGVLMAVHSCTPDQAWHVLREASQVSNTKLRTVAAAVTAGAVPGGPPPPPEIRAALRTALGRLPG